MDRNYCVYMHKNKLNNKVYIGITGQKPELRWNEGKGYKYNSHFYAAINKYGWYEGFEHIILYDNLTKEEAERQTGARVNSIIQCCNGKYKHANGYKWKYVD